MLESDGPGGAERVLLSLAEELRRREHRVCPVGPAAGCGWLGERFRERGFEPEVFRLRRAVDWACVRGLLEVMRRRRVDVLHCHEFTMAVYGAAAGALLRRPVVITMHGGRGYEGRRRRRLALRWAVRRSAFTTAVSPPTREALEKSLRLAPGSVRVIPNGVRPERGEREPVRRELGLGEDELLVVAVGNLYRVKGHDVLLRALGWIATEHRTVPWRLAIAGRGSEEEELRSLSAELGIDDRVHLLGFRSDVPDLLAAADVFAMSSRSEGLPMALLEAMFAARPIVASAVGGIPEAVEDDRTGLLVPPDAPPELGRALVALMRDRSLAARLGRAARREASRRYGVEAMVDEYERLYRAAAPGQT